MISHQAASFDLSPSGELNRLAFRRCGHKTGFGELGNVAKHLRFFPWALGKNVRELDDWTAGFGAFENGAQHVFAVKSFLSAALRKPSRQKPPAGSCKKSPCKKTGCGQNNQGAGRHFGKDRAHHNARQRAGCADQRGNDRHGAQIVCPKSRSSRRDDKQGDDQKNSHALQADDCYQNDRAHKQDIKDFYRPTRRAGECLIEAQ